MWHVRSAADLGLYLQKQPCVAISSLELSQHAVQVRSRCSGTRAGGRAS